MSCANDVIAARQVPMNNSNKRSAELTPDMLSVCRSDARSAEAIRTVVEVAAAKFLHGYDQEFFRRVWSTNLETYRKRLTTIGFESLGHVLDAGSGNGQWTLCLADLNGHVSAVDISGQRLNATRHIMTSLRAANVHLTQQSVETLDFPDESFDAVFCYSVLYFVDHVKAINEFFRVLKPGGSIYVCTNGLGWYVHNAITPHNPSPHFDIRKMAIKAIHNTITYLSTGERDSDAQLIVPSRLLSRTVADAGFEGVTIGAEGTLARRHRDNPKSFFKSSYHGMEGVYELLATKPPGALEAAM